MKQLLIIATIALSVIGRAYSADCIVNLRAKSEKAKSAKLDGVSFSEKQISALKTICNVKIGLMGKEELIADYTKTLERKLEREAKKQ